MKYIKYVLLVLLGLLLTRELIGLFQWFVIDGKSWTDFKKLTVGQIQDELTDELAHPINHYAKLTRKGNR